MEISLKLNRKWVRSGWESDDNGIPVNPCLLFFSILSLVFCIFFKYNTSIIYIKYPKNYQHIQSFYKKEQVIK